MILLNNTTIHTMVGPKIEGGFVLIDQGKIEGVFEKPPTVDCPKIDCTGCVVTPGLIDCHSHVSLFGEPRTRPGLNLDGNEVTDPLTPQLRAEDAIYPFDPAIETSREAGFTTLFILPGSANLIGGTGCAVKLRGKTINEMKIPGTEAMKFALGENPKRNYGELLKTAPMTRMANLSMIRDLLNRTKEYMEKKKDSKNCSYNDKHEALVPVLKGTMKVRIHCHRADDIWSAIRLAEEFGLDYCLEHVTEGYMIVDGLAEKRPNCVVGPLWMQPGKQEVWNITHENPYHLFKAGLELALTADASSETAYLPIQVGTLMRYGLAEDTLLRSLTIVPAKIIGIEDKVGTIEKGKSADISVFDGPPLLNTSKCIQVFIDGEEVFRDK